MSRDRSDDGPDPSARPSVLRRQIDPDPTTAEYDFLELVAELDGRRIEDLPSLYDEVDHVVETLFETPPSPDSHLEIEFTYDGFRVTMDQRGHVKLVRVG